MRLIPLLPALMLSLTAVSQRTGKIHAKAVVVDGHNDVLSSAVLDGVDISRRVPVGHSDLDRWKEGGVDVQFFSVWTGDKPRSSRGFFHDTEEEIDSLAMLVSRNTDRMILAKSYADVRKGIRQGKLVALIGVEGGHMIEEDPAKLEILYQRGMRYLTLTWNNSTEWATSAKDETENAASLQRKGLSEFGRQMLRRMNELGVIVDLSHVGEQTFFDAMATTTKPVMLSHSSVWNICPVFRNVKDEQIRAVARNKGVICINFYSGFISRGFDDRLDQFSNKYRRIFLDSLRSLGLDSGSARELWRTHLRTQMKQMQPKLGELVDHIDYIVKLVGDDYVGLGSDFDGVSSLPEGLDDVAAYPKITAELVRRGYSRGSINKILGGNLMRVMKANFR